VPVSVRPFGSFREHLRALQRLDRRFLVTHMTTACTGGAMSRPNHIGRLLANRIVCSSTSSCDRRDRSCVCAGTPRRMHVDAPRASRTAESVPTGNAFGWWPIEPPPVCACRWLRCRSAAVTERGRSSSPSSLSRQKRPRHKLTVVSRIQLTRQISRRSQIRSAASRRSVSISKLSLLCEWPRGAEIPTRALLSVQRTRSHQYHRALKPIPNVTKCKVTQSLFSDTGLVLLRHRFLRAETCGWSGRSMGIAIAFAKIDESICCWSHRVRTWSCVRRGGASGSVTSGTASFLNSVRNRGPGGESSTSRSKESPRPRCTACWWWKPRHPRPSKGPSRPLLSS